MFTIQANESGLSSKVLTCIQAGESVLIEQGDHSFAILIPAQPPGKPRPSGLCKGDFVVPDDFNEPLDVWEDFDESP